MNSNNSNIFDLPFLCKTINWTSDNISNTLFLPATHNELGKKSNRYNMFVSVAFHCYMNMIVEGKEAMIEIIIDTKPYVTSLVTKVLVNRKWSKMEQGMKTAWSRRAERLKNTLYWGNILMYLLLWLIQQVFCANVSMRRWSTCGNHLRNPWLLKNKISQKNQRLFLPMKFVLGVWLTAVYQFLLCFASVC